MGLLAVVALSVSRWARRAFRFLPFVYATVVSLAWFWSSTDSAWDLIQHVLVVNLVAGFFLAIAWFEFKRKT